MNLTKALWILDRAHTRDDEMVGYVVETTPNLFGLGFSRHEYTEAWGVVRAALRPAVAPICNVCGAPDIHTNPICVEYADCIHRIAAAVRRGHMEHAQRMIDELREFEAEHPVEVAAFEAHYNKEGAR